MMKVVFAGERALGGQVLQMLADSCDGADAEIISVLTHRPEASSWWYEEDAGMTPWDVARSVGLEIIGTEALPRKRWDLLLSVYWPRIFSMSELSGGALNVNLHTAPLPEFRGRYSCSMAILSGYHEFGPTLHAIDEGVDTGPVIATLRFSIEEHDTARNLYDKTNAASLRLMKEQLPLLLHHRFSVTEQLVLAAENGLPVQHFGRDALDAFLDGPPRKLEPDAANTWVRALTFPPRYAPSEWVVAQAARTNCNSLYPLERGPRGARLIP